MRSCGVARGADMGGADVDKQWPIVGEPPLVRNAELQVIAIAINRFFAGQRDVGSEFYNVRNRTRIRLKGARHDRRSCHRTQPHRRRIKPANRRLAPRNDPEQSGVVVRNSNV